VAPFRDFLQYDRVGDQPVDYRYRESARRIRSTWTITGLTIRRLTWTEGILTRKNLEPFRISAGIFYSYHLPGSDAGQTTYPSDIVNTRVVIEHMLDDKRGFGYNLEFVGFHGLSWRANGHTINVGGQNGFNSLGVQPTIQYRLGDHWVGAAGVLFTVAGQITQDAIFPNFSIYYYWGKADK